MSEFQVPTQRQNTRNTHLRPPFSVHANNYELGCEILRPNGFVIVTTKIAHIRGELKPNNVCAWSLQIREFMQWSVRVQIMSSDLAKVENNGTHVIMILAADLRRFIHILQEAHLMTKALFTISFGLLQAAKDSLPLQRRLLLPFKQLHATCRRVIIPAGADQTLAENLSKDLLSTIDWTRLRSHNFLQIMQARQEFADDLLDTGYYMHATKVYGEITDSLGASSLCIAEILEGDDDVMFETLGTFLAQHHYNQALARLWDAYEELCKGNDRTAFKIAREFLNMQRMILRTPILTKYVFAAYHLVTGVARMYTGEYSNMGEHFRRGALNAPDDANLKAVQKLSASFTAETPPVRGDRLRHTMSDMMRHLPKKALRQTASKEVAVAAGLDQERYKLCKLGFRGDILEHCLTQKVGWSLQAGEDGREEVEQPFDLQRADRLVEKRLRKMKEAENRGRHVRFAIGSNVRPGEEENLEYTAALRESLQEQAMVYNLGMINWGMWTTREESW